MKKLIILVLTGFFLNQSFAQTDKSVTGCRTFTVGISSPITITTEVTVCCGCNMIHVCGCSFSKNSNGDSFTGYALVDDIVKDSDASTVTITYSTTARSNDDVDFHIIPGTYSIITDSDGHKEIAVTVSDATL